MLLPRIILRLAPRLIRVLGAKIHPALHRFLHRLAIFFALPGNQPNSPILELLGQEEGLLLLDDLLDHALVVEVLDAQDLLLRLVVRGGGLGDVLQEVLVFQVETPEFAVVVLVALVPEFGRLVVAFLGFFQLRG